MFHRSIADAAWLRPRAARRERLSTRVAILLVSLTTLLLWLGLTEALVQWL